MFAMLIVAVSLLTQAYIFRDLEKWESNVEVNMLDRHGEDVLAEAEAEADAEADRSSAESDRSRNEGIKEGR